jgi:hypothetical protein
VQDRPESEELSADEAQVDEKEVVGTQNADSSPPVPKKSRANEHPRIAQRSVDGYGEFQLGEASTGETSGFNGGPGNPAHVSSNFNANAIYPPLNPFHYPQPMIMPGYFHLPYMPYQYPYPYAAPPLPQHEMKNEADQNSHEQGSPRKSGKTLTASESSTPDTPRPTNQSTSNESFTYGWGSPAGNPPSFPYPPHPFNPMMRGGMMMYPPPAAFMFGAGQVPPSLGVPLSLQVDQERLSEYQIAIRKQLELFEASLEDVESNTQGRKKAVKAGQGNSITATSVTSVHCQCILTAGSRLFVRNSWIAMQALCDGASQVPRTRGGLLSLHAFGRVPGGTEHGI